MEAGAALLVPDDVLADILGRLPPRALAASRSVCKAWRALVDARGLLLRHLLPHALRGILIDYSGYKQPVLFARRSQPRCFPRVSGDLGYVPGFGPYHSRIIDHCNGLLLYQGASGYYVINPATRGWESFWSPRVDRHGDHAACLVFDPAASPPRYEVFWIPHLPEPEESVRPAAPFSLGGLFSSDDTLAMPCKIWRRRRKSNRFSLKLGKYRVIKTPEDIEQVYAECYLGKSTGGVCFAILCDHQLRIWNLNDELSGKAEWVLKHRVDLDHSALWAAVRLSERDTVTRGSWMLSYSDSDEDSGRETYDSSGEDCGSEIVSEEQFQWDSDDDCVVDYEDDGDDDDEDHEFKTIFFLGFHPYREVVFLMVSSVTVAYHLSTSKFQWLGKSLPKRLRGQKALRSHFHIHPA
ncbi:unnamed protein product [Urochloa decumbens]|uniref:F-box domain-containing protein n=1 Tax=Urochloa decumbens TaxID=240449 RepID=A0ABC8WSA0_9POAL